MTIGALRDYLRALRPHQWVKNLLVFAPLIAAHETTLGSYLVAAGLFAALSAVASGAYVLNDMLDLPHDRRHETKRYRPLAAGKVSPFPLLGLGAALTAGGLGLAFALSAPAASCVLLYLVMTVAYSLWLKRKTFIDIITLSLLYAVRVLTGAIAVSVPLSPWFLAFFLFVFLALAIVKRQSELYALHESGRSAVGGRAYFAEDLITLTALGTANITASVVVFTLYIQSPEVHTLYARPDRLWLICPLLIYWMGRMTLLANRGAVNNDPLVFTLGDRASWLTGFAALVVFAAAL